ncbi:MAG: DUF1127 domain-containing protein [Alphaproteobacteria bacterium]|nr:DUF1127 domain-containing protein [Alphaproteobacteria bacterium]MCW5738837.1 DUF1127 domain-containing protein [Alphaproteobacteria bacterium]
MSHFRSDLQVDIPTFQSLIAREAKPTLTARIIETLRLWHERRAARRELTRIDARSLRDVGIAPELVAYEIAQPFWRDLRDWRA